LWPSRLTPLPQLTTHAHAGVSVLRAFFRLPL
jgi:hypothetical protein